MHTYSLATVMVADGKNARATAPAAGFGEGLAGLRLGLHLVHYPLQIV